MNTWRIGWAGVALVAVLVCGGVGLSLDHALRTGVIEARVLPLAEWRVSHEPIEIAYCTFNGAGAWTLVVGDSYCLGPLAVRVHVIRQQADGQP